MTRSARRGAIGHVVVFLLAALLTIAAPAQVAAQAAFPKATPESRGMSSAALAELADVVRGYVDRDMAVGAELVVIKDHHTVLHEAFGWRDREARVPMERGSLFNIRSMTKPITGAAIQLLIDEGTLSLDDRASDYLPGFDTDEARGITLEQLLTHTSGLPLTVLQGARDYESLVEMADAIGAGGPEFEPGSRFWYSDAGADVLGAIVEVASGMPLEAFVRSRLLEPLGMDDTFYANDPSDPRVERIATLYLGRVGTWSEVWGPGDEPFYPYAWGSQSLYGTPLDYARFLAMWIDGGLSGDDRVLSTEAIERTLTPTAAMGSLGSDAPYPTRYDGLAAYHGQMALLHLDEASVQGQPLAAVRPVIVGYSGSDGTIAWAWPDRDLVILYFTQSRGGSTAIRLEDEIERLLLAPPEEAGSEMPAGYAEYLGTYTADFGPFVDEPFEVLWRDGSLALDIPSQFIYPLDRVDTEDRWTLRDDPGVAISFARDPNGVVSALRIEDGGEVTEVPRGGPATGPEVLLRFEDVERYLGVYREATGREVELVFQDGRLALRIPEAAEPLGLLPPTADGTWRLAMNPTVTIRFTESDGEVVSYTVSAPGGEASFEKVGSSDPAVSDG